MLVCTRACGRACVVGSPRRFASLAKYAALFDEQSVTFEGFLDLNEEMLIDMGIVTFGAKRRILRTVCELRVPEIHDLRCFCCASSCPVSS